MVKLKYILLFYSFLIFIGCSKTFNNNNLPQLPSVNSIIFDTFCFDNDTIKFAENNNYYNWNNASNKLLYWTEFIQSNILSTYTAFNLLSNSYSQHYSNSTWLWNCNFKMDSTFYESSLFGTFEVDSSSLWELFISVDGNSSNLLLNGYSNYDLTKGNWTISKYVYLQVNVLDIEWKKSDDFLIVKYTNIYEQSSFYGSILTIYYPLQKNDTTYFEIYQKRNNMITNIEIFPDQKSGKIKDFTAYEDTAWHCWDATFVDIDCN
jgi:hypothetical protein